jgi:hypothetical protein
MQLKKRRLEWTHPSPLQEPRTRRQRLFEGTHIFALELDEETTIAKISRGFDAIAVNDELTLKISSKSLANVLAHKLFKLMARDSFKRNKEFEIT